jgi:hypothetical protein
VRAVKRARKGLRRGSRGGTEEPEKSRVTQAGLVLSAMNVIRRARSRRSDSADMGRSVLRPTETQAKACATGSGALTGSYGEWYK